MPIKEGHFHRYAHYRSHGEDGLCVIFHHAGKEMRPSELTGHMEDHFKLPALKLPKRVVNMMGKNEIIATQSWKALLDFDGGLRQVTKNLVRMQTIENFSRHPGTTIERLLNGGLDSVKEKFYEQVEENELGHVKRGRLAFDSFEETTERALNRYAAKMARRDARLAP